MQKSGPNPTIQDVIVHLAGEFAPQIAEIWRTGSGVAEYVLATSAQRHTWHAVLSVERERLPEVNDLRGWLTETKRRDLLKAAFGSVPPGMVNLLSKLGLTAETPEFYRAAYVVLERGGCLARFLQHQPQVSADFVHALAELPDDAQTEKMAEAALKYGASGSQLAEICWLGEQVANVYGLSASSIRGRPFAVLKNLIAAQPFPKPPFLVDGIMPVLDPNDLKSISRQFGNCLSDQDLLYSACVDVQAGNAYYFKTEGDDFLLLKFCRFANLGWFFDECAGRGNRRMTSGEYCRLQLGLSAVSHVFDQRLSYHLR